MNQRKIGTLLSYLHILISNTISIIYTPYMLQMMGQSEYGLYGTASSFIAYLSILNFGIGGAYIRFNARCRTANDRTAEKQLNGMFFTVFFVLSLLVFIGGMGCIVLADQLVNETFTAQELFKLRIILFLLTINMMITFIFNVVMMALQAYEKYIVLRVVTLITCILTPFVNIFALKLGGRSITITAISLLFSIACYAIFAIYARKAIKLEFSFKGFRKDALKEIFVFSSFLFLNSITDQITFSTDSIIISSIKGTSAVAIYTIGSQFRNYFQQFATSVASVFSPSVNLMVAQGQDISELDSVFTRVGRIQFYIVSLILLGYLSIGEAFVNMWAGEDYSNSFIIGLLLILSVFVPSFQSIGLEIQKAYNKHKARSIVYFLIALLNILLTIPFTKIWSGTGAALATLITTFFGYVVFMNYYYWKKIGLNIPCFWKSIASILPGYIPPAVVGFLINQYWKFGSFTDILISAIIISITLLFSIFFFSMNTYEKQLIETALRKFFKRK